MSFPPARYTIRPASADDLDAVLALRREAEEWLHARGIKQWTQQWGETARGLIREGIDEGYSWVICDRSEVVATVTLKGPDLDFWEPADDPASGLYLYKLIIARSHGGTGLGDLILDWAADRAARLGKTWLRLDCWRDNTGLHRYYLDRGFVHVRTVVRSWRESGALFQRPAHRTDNLPLQQLERHDKALSGAARSAS